MVKKGTKGFRGFKEIRATEVNRDDKATQASLSWGLLVQTGFLDLRANRASMGQMVPQDRRGPLDRGVHRETPDPQGASEPWVRLV